jgi:hypothetical protein
MKLTYLLLLSLTACGGDTFTIGPFSEASADAADPAEASADSDAGDARIDTKTDSSSEASTDAGIDAACVDGVQACEDVWTGYCSRLKSCCNGLCNNSWQNNGGAECFNHFLANSNIYVYCAGGSRQNDKRCEQPCLGDIQIASCGSIIQSSTSTGISATSLGCAAFWQ